MPSEKTKQLLEGLGRITDSAPKVRESEKYHSFTNRFYPNSLHQLPKSYDKARRKKDEDGEQYIMIDRVYGDLWNTGRLQQKDGTVYNGKLYKKRRLLVRKDPITGETSNFYSACTSTADGRWFDNQGLPIDPPSSPLDDEVKESNVEIVKMPPTAEETEQIRKQKFEQEQRILQSLK